MDVCMYNIIGVGSSCGDAAINTATFGSASQRQITKPHSFRGIPPHSIFASAGEEDQEEND